MKYLITGSTGFIGSNLCSDLIKNNDVRSIPRDYLYSYYQLKEYIESYSPDVIVHLAAYGNHYTQRDILQTIEANINVVVNLLQASQAVNYRSFINVSTSSVDLDIDTYYSATKLCAEKICKTYQREFSKPIISVRPYSVYGPGEAEFRFIPSVIRSAKYEKTLVVDPSPRHDWIYIDDFINAIYKIVDNSDKLISKSIKIGTGLSWTNDEIVKAIEKIHGKKIDYKVSKSLRDYDTDNWVADTSLLTEIGWERYYSLIEGLEKTYAYY